MRDSAESRSGSNEKSCYWRRRCRSIPVALVGSDWGDSVKDYQVFCPEIGNIWVGELGIILRRQPYHGQPCHHCSSLCWPVNRLANLMSSLLLLLSYQIITQVPNLKVSLFFSVNGRMLENLAIRVRVGIYDLRVKRTPSSRKKEKCGNFVEMGRGNTIPTGQKCQIRPKFPNGGKGWVGCRWLEGKNFHIFPVSLYESVPNLNFKFWQCQWCKQRQR